MPRRYWPVIESGLRHHLLRRALRNDLAAMRAGAGPHVEQVIRGHHRFRVMLHHHDRIAEIAKPQQGLKSRRLSR